LPPHYKTPTLGPSLGTAFGLGPSLGGALVGFSLGPRLHQGPPRLGPRHHQGLVGALVTKSIENKKESRFRFD
jgi:hypothetical protein